MSDTSALALLRKITVHPQAHSAPIEVAVEQILARSSAQGGNQCAQLLAVRLADVCEHQGLSVETSIGLVLTLTRQGTRWEVEVSAEGEREDVEEFRRDFLDYLRKYSVEPFA